MYATRRDTLAAGEPGRRKRRIATFGTISALTGLLIGTVGLLPPPRCTLRPALLSEARSSTTTSKPRAAQQYAP